MKKLCRTRVSNFDIKDSVTLKELEERKDNLSDYVYTMDKIFEDFDNIELDERKLPYLINGVRITYKEKDGVYNIYCNKKYIGLGVIENNLLKRDVLIIDKVP